MATIITLNDAQRVTGEYCLCLTLLTELATAPASHKITGITT